MIKENERKTGREGRHIGRKIKKEGKKETEIERGYLFSR